MSPLEDSAFDDCPSLKIIRFLNTQLTVVDEKILTKKVGRTLKDLDLTQNKLESFSFIHLHQLLILKLSETPLKRVTKAMFPPSLANLNKLHMYSCNIEEIDEDAFINLT